MSKATATGRRFDGYIRVSRVGGREGDRFISPDEQRQKISEWAKLRGVTIADWHTDLDQSGGKLSRPGLDALMARIESGATDGVAVARLDRLSRAGVADALRLVEEIHNHGAKLAAVDLGIDPTTTFGEFALTIMLALARMERRRLAEGWDAAKRRAVDRGVHFTRAVPFGYERENGHPLEPVPELVPIVNGIFERRAERQSAWAITDWLNERHPRDDGRRWSEAMVERIWRNRLYLGEAFHGDHRNTEAHDPIVSPSLFAAANAVSGGTGRPARESPPLLGGSLLRCAGCRYVMQITTQKQRNGSHKEYYRCRGKHGGGDCPEPATVAANKIEPVVVLYALAFAGSSTWQDEGPATDDLRAWEAELEHADRRRAAFLADDELRERVARDAYLSEAERREREVEEAQARLDAERAAHGAADHRRHVLVEEWLEWDVAERAAALRQIFDTIYVRRGRGSVADRLAIFHRGTDQNERPVRGGTRYVTTPIPWPEPLDGPGYDAEYEPELTPEAKSSSVSLDGLRAALVDYPAASVSAAFEGFGVSDES